ncbi:hypothetical protein TNCV_526271 [Trichonephila clavipes]|nr:hypothetical protein TNCV_526271 [Trichonephila clavipes]
MHNDSNAEISNETPVKTVTFFNALHCLETVQSTIQVAVRIRSAKFPKRAIVGDTTYLHIHNLDMELKGRVIFSNPLTPESAHKTFEPTYLTSTFSEGIWWHRTPGLPVWSPML